MIESYPYAIGRAAKRGCAWRARIMARPRAAKAELMILCARIGFNP